MPDVREFALPDVGEGLTEAEVVSWLVAVGDEVKVNDSIVEIETAKSVVELPSPFAGRVERIMAAPGDTVAVGSPLIAIASSASEPPSPPASSPSQPSDSGDTEKDAKKPAAVLVGYGVSESAAPRRRLTPNGNSTITAPVPAPTPSGRVAAWPPARALAAQLGLDIATVSTARPGPVSTADVRAAAAISAPALTRRPSTDADETRVPIRGVRKATATAMVTSAFTAPHAAVWLSVDLTASMNLLATLRRDAQWAEVRLSPLSVVAFALTRALTDDPQLNSTWDEAAQEIVTKHYVNLGIAAATPRGLLVPNIKNAQSLGFRELCEQLAALVASARENRVAPGALGGGTVTITNLGPLGIDGGIPILNPGESAILAVGAIRPTPWVVDGRVEVRQVAQLAISFDHRVADGAEAAALLRAVGGILTEPALAMVR